MGVLEDNLVEIPLRFCDGSVHYYDSKTDAVYSRRFSSGEWYISSYADNIKFQYLHPEEYTQQIEEALKIVNQIELQRKNYYAQFMSKEALLDKHSRNRVLIPSRDLIKDIIDNKHYLVYTGK